ncbi:MAG: mechanosensitive ion channel family protein [Thermodesulfobacteriota bacterium]
MSSVADQVLVFITTYGINIIGAIVILIVGRIAAGMGRGIVKRVLEKRETEPAIVSFMESLTYILIIVFAVLAALAKFGVQTASFIAVLGAAGLAIGFALQGSLANFAAGVLILVLRPFRVNDYIIGGGEGGTVKKVQLFTTELATPDNVKVIVPNSKIFGDVIKNYSANDIRRVDFVIGIGYSSDIQKAYDIMMDLVNQDSRILSDPPVQIAVSELADSSVNFVLRPWVKKEDYWTVKFELTRKIKESFDENNIEIPFPQQTVHVVSKKS